MGRGSPVGFRFCLLAVPDRHAEDGRYGIDFCDPFLLLRGGDGTVDAGRAVFLVAA